MKIPKNFWGPKAGPGPHTEKGSLCSHDAAAHRQQFRPVTIWAPPPDEILDPPLELTSNRLLSKIAFPFLLTQLQLFLSISDKNIHTSSINNYKFSR